MNIRAILFDAGNTLIRVADSVGAVYAEVAARHGVTADPDRLDHCFDRQFSLLRRKARETSSNPRSATDDVGWWMSLVEAVLRDAGAWDQAADVFNRYFEDLYREFEHPARWQVFPDVLPCLGGLERRAIRVAVVSNWDRRLPTLLTALGLAHRFRFVLTSGEFGVEKPAPAIFHEAASRLGLPPGEVLHVGDHYEDDLVGPERAGMGSLLIDRRAPQGRCGRRIQYLTELVRLVEGEIDYWALPVSTCGSASDEGERTACRSASKASR